LARFISRHPKYSVGVRSEVVDHFASGEKHVAIRGLEARFNRRLTTDYEKEVGVSTFKFPGIPEDRDTRSDVAGFSRISCFDTEQAKAEQGWTDDEHELVLAKLRTHPQYGQELVEVMQPKRPAPWAGYDNLSPAKIADAVALTGVPVAEVIAYEQENEAREEVLADLELLLEDEPAEEIVSA
jgi:hypothetical protein